MEDKLQELVDRLKHAQRERLQSVILYGSAASGEGPTCTLVSTAAP